MRARNYVSRSTVSITFGRVLADVPSGFTLPLFSVGPVRTLPPASRFMIDDGRWSPPGNALTIRHSGKYHVLAASNLAAPLSSWSVVSSGAFAGDGSFSVTIP
jgi:hypothetical protein